MIDAVLRVGDKVIITIPAENREWGYNPCPDGTTATVLAFSEIEYGRIHNYGYRPGVYVNRAWTTVRLKNGTEYTEYTGRLALADKAEYERRVTEWRALHANGGPMPHDFLRDLPETPFWEGDKVRLRRPSEPETMVIIRINYPRLTATRNDGSPYPAYHVSDQLGGSGDMAVSTEDMELIEHGNVWKFFHDKPLKFADLREEADFFQALGHTDEIRNPGNQLYSWTKDEVLAAIQNGVVDAFTMSHGLFGSSPSISAIKYRDQNLGRRVAAMTLAGFGLATA